jgi:FkbM family methyltransferase
MRLYESIASKLIGTPLHAPAEGFRWLCSWPDRLKHPELHEIHYERRRAKDVVARIVTDGVNGIDVGCHLGSVLTEIVTRSPTGHHLAVEPVPYKAAWLRKKFPHVDVHQVALGFEVGPVEFHFNTKNSCFSALKLHGGEQTSTLTVDCRRLDDLVPEGLRIGFMKVDVEGGELDVFRGATRVLTVLRPVILFECTQFGLATFEVTARDIFSLLVNERSYRIYLLKDWLSQRPPLDVVQFEASMIYPFRAFNYVAEPAEASTVPS